MKKIQTFVHLLPVRSFCIILTLGFASFVYSQKPPAKSQAPTVQKDGNAAWVGKYEFEDFGKRRNRDELVPSINYFLEISKNKRTGKISCSFNATGYQSNEEYQCSVKAADDNLSVYFEKDLIHTSDEEKEFVQFKNGQLLFNLVKSQTGNKTLEEYKVKTIHHPVRHLLLMNFLDITPVKFFTVFTEFKPFGYGPYSCLNKASDHYRELRIQKCQIYDNLSKEEKFRGSIAVFSCDCGFIYQRRGPDKSNEDRFFYDSVREYGTVWENTLAQLWADSSFSLTHIGEKLGVSSTSVGRHAIRLNLPMNTKNTRSLNGYDRHRNPKPSFSEMRGNYRNEWLNLRKNNLKLTRLELMKKFNFIYLWLKRNDSEWFESHLPKITRVSEKNDILDWEKIDKQLSEEVSYICDEIFNIKTFPIRISITEIIRRAGNKGWIEKRKIKLPMTSVVIDKKLESLEEFMIRKVEWAENEFLKKGKIPTQMELKVTARVRNKTSEKSEKVQQSINEAIKKLESLLL